MRELHANRGVFPINLSPINTFNTSGTNIGSTKKTADTDMPQTDTHLMEWIRKKRECLDALRPLDRDLVEKLHEEMRLLHTYNSNAIGLTQHPVKKN